MEPGRPSRLDSLLAGWSPRLALVSMLAATIALMPVNIVAHAGGNHNPPAPLALASSTGSMNPNAPPWCFTEDDWSQQIYAGALNGSYGATAELCGLPADFFNGIWWNAGGIGLESDVYVVGQLSDLAISAPDGTTHHATLMGQTTSKHVTTYHYAVCYVPPYSILTDVGGTPLIGGSWSLALSGSLSTATWYVNVEMTDAQFQQSHCPTQQQNLAA